MKSANVRGRLYWAFGSLLAVLLILIAVAWRSFEGLSSVDSDNDSAYQVLLAIHDVETGLANVRAEMSFLQVGRTIHAQGHDLTRLERDLAHLHRLIADDRTQQPRLQRIEVLKATWIRDYFIPMQVRLKENPQRPLNEMKSLADFDDRLMNELHGQLEEMQHDEDRRLARSEGQEQMLLSLTRQTFLIVGVFSIGLALVLSTLLAGSAERLQKANTTLSHEVVERTRIEVALRQSEERLAGILDSLDDIVWSVSADMNTVHYVNRAAEKVYGRPISEFFGNLKLWEQVVHPEDREILHNFYKVIFEQGVMEAEYRILRLDGAVRWLHIQARLALDDQGKPERIDGTATDITERKHATIALQESDKRFHHVTANVPGMVYLFMIHPDGSIEVPWVSEGSRELLGLEPEHVQSDAANFTGMIHPEDRPGFERSVAESAQSLQPWLWQGRITLPDGETKWIESAARPEALPGNVIQWSGLLLDITARKIAEEQLRISEERSRTLLRSLPQGVFFKDVNSGFISVNQSFSDTFEIAQENIVGKTDFDIVPRELAEKYRADDQRILATGRPELLEEQAFMKGESRIVETIKTPVIADDGTVVGILGLITDVTERRQAASSLQQAKDELEVRVMERTAELAGANESLRAEIAERHNAEAAMRAAKEEAEQANRAKSEFLSRMSHELRTPMNAILGFGQILEMRQLSAKDSDGVQQILKAGRHLLQLINEVLEISRIESGRVSLSIEPVEVLPLLREVLDMAQPLAPQRKISLLNEAAREAPACQRYVLADQQRLQQVMVNLLSNAIKYNRECGTVTLSLQEMSESDIGEDGGNAIKPDYLRIEVSDSGHGITPEDQQKLFMPFERLGAVLTNIEGTGIGLSLTKRLVELMNGRIGVESQPGHGSTFWVELPLAQSPSNLLHPPDSGLSSPSPSLFSIARSVTLLYIEDNASNIGVMETLLEDMHHVRLLTAIQGGIGLELAQQHRPDLILLDLHLPDIQGDEVLRQLQTDPTTSDIPVVMISADATSKQVAKLLDAGALHYLTKPFDVKQLMQLLEELLQKKE